MKMSKELLLKCRTCLSDSNVFYQLFDYVDDNYKILEMIYSIVPQIDIKTTKSQFSTIVCKCCVDKLVTGFKFQQLCIETNNRLHDYLGIAVCEKEPHKLVTISDPLTGESNYNMKQEIVDDASLVCEINPDELEVAIKSEDNDNDWRSARILNDKKSSNEKSTKNSPLKVAKIGKANIKNRSDERFPCLKCGKVFDRQYSLRRHGNVHLKKRPFSCDICKLSFAVEKLFEAHKLTHKNADASNREDNDKYENIEIKKCKEFNENKECNQSKPKNDDKESGQNNELKLELPFQSPERPRCFGKKTSISAHYKVHGTKENNEMETDDFDTNAEWFNNEYDDSEPNSSNKRSGNFPCEVCGKKFPRSYGLKRHSLVHSLTRPHACEICKYRFNSIHILKQHMFYHDNLNSNGSRLEGFKCPDCPRRFKKQSSLTAHCQNHPRNEKHKCDQCDKHFVRKVNLVKHLNWHKDNKTLECHICEKDTLKEHMCTHSVESPHLCSQCGKTFQSDSSLRRHIERHAGLKKYQCSKCPSRFVCKSYLMKHIVRHTNAKPYICDICGSRFTEPYSLRKHKRLHSGERPFKCDQCSMTFVIGYTLRRHMRTHTGEKPYKCKYCDRAYSASGDLTKHLRTHVGENTYICDQCPMAFKYHAELKQHQSEHYQKEQKLLQQS